MKKKQDPDPHLQESESTWLSENTELQGQVEFKGSVRIFGRIRGEVRGAPGSELILMPTGVIEGKISGDLITIAGYASGEIISTGKLVIASTGKVVGKVQTPKLQVDFGAIVECETSMPERAPAPGSKG